MVAQLGGREGGVVGWDGVTCGNGARRPPPPKLAVRLLADEGRSAPSTTLRQVRRRRGEYEAHSGGVAEEGKTRCYQVSI